MARGGVFYQGEDTRAPALTSAGTAGQVLKSNGAGADPTFQSGGSGSGAVVQVVNTHTGEVATGTTAIPNDDTIPQNTEGTEFMTLAITPTSAANKLRIDVVLNGSVSVAETIVVGLFQDTTTNALAGDAVYQGTATGQLSIAFSHYMTSDTTSSTTFKVRAGPGTSGTVTFNGQAGARRLGGVLSSSITITEIVP